MDIETDRNKYDPVFEKNPLHEQLTPGHIRLFDYYKKI